MELNLSTDECLQRVTATIREVCGVDGLAPDQDFYDAGVSSVQALPLLMELESRFDISIPDGRFVAARSAGALSSMIREIKEG
jgi:acyl carrier protein